MIKKPTYEELEQAVFELKRENQSPKSVEDRFKVLSEASLEAIYLSEKNICFDQDLAAERIFGYTRIDAIG